MLLSGFDATVSIPFQSVDEDGTRIAEMARPIVQSSR
jgi:hypothetical protein